MSTIVLRAKLNALRSPDVPEAVQGSLADKLHESFPLSRGRSAALFGTRCVVFCEAPRVEIKDA